MTDASASGWRSFAATLGKPRLAADAAPKIAAGVVFRGTSEIVDLTGFGGAAHDAAGWRGLAMDAEHWITIHPNGPDNKGQPALINGAGQIIGGAGGKLNGKFVNPSSKSAAKSGSTSQHSPAIWLGPGPEKRLALPKPAEAPKPPEAPPFDPRAKNPHPYGSKEAYEFERVKKAHLSDEANKLSENAKTLDEHRKAMAAHHAAYLSWKDWAKTRRNEMNNHAFGYNKHKSEIKRLEKEAKKDQPKTKKKAESTGGKSFAKDTPKEIHDYMKERFGLGFINGVKHGDDKKAFSEWYKHPDKDGEDGKAKREQYNKIIEAKRSDPGYRIKGHTPIDITQSGASAKGMREIVSQVNDALTKLEADGFDVKKALSKAHVVLAAGSTGKSCGHAWYRNEPGKGDVGYFSISPSKRGEFNQGQAEANDARIAAGKANWSVSASSKDQARATIVHELAHALGLRSSVRSADRLMGVLQKLNIDYTTRQKWIRENISEYATTNIKETDAELAALVTSPEYKRGTLPKELEDHVDWLFDHKGRDHA
jgi:hypothetical protein